MNSSAINSSPPFNHSSSGSSLPLSNAYFRCLISLNEFWFDYIVKVINLVVGYPANIMVMWLVARKKNDSSTSDIFIFNLAIADGFFVLMTPINYFGYVRVGMTFFLKLQFFNHTIKYTTPLFLTCICLDRYVAVVHPSVFTSIKDSKIRLAISMLVWGFMLTYSIIRPLQMDPKGNIFVAMILPVFAIMVFCNISIIWRLRKSVLGKEKIHPMKKKALSTVQITLAIIVFHYLPVFTFFMSIRYFRFLQFCQLQIIFLAFMVISSSTEPLLYISTIEKLPRLKHLLCICSRSPSPEPHNVSKGDVCL